jgi:hydrogenase nickel incorporation protein HypB
MCQDCGCSSESISVEKQILHANNHMARHNRDMLENAGVLAINLMSSPGAGKTTLLEHLAEKLQGKYRMAVIEGDLETENDADRIRQKGVPCVQIQTGTSCHLDADHIHKALHHIDLENTDILFIENVGNLVCPASFELGSHKDFVLLSVPEGDDKPVKYPVMFRKGDFIVISKTDLQDYIPGFSATTLRNNLDKLGKSDNLLEFSIRDETGLNRICQVINDLFDQFQELRQQQDLESA